MPPALDHAINPPHRRQRLIELRDVGHLDRELHLRHARLAAGSHLGDIEPVTRKHIRHITQQALPIVGPQDHINRIDTPHSGTNAFIA